MGEKEKGVVVVGELTEESGEGEVTEVANVLRLVYNILLTKKSCIFQDFMQFLLDCIVPFLMPT